MLPWIVKCHEGWVKARTSADDVVDLPGDEPPPTAAQRAVPNPALSRQYSASARVLHSGVIRLTNSVPTRTHWHERTPPDWQSGNVKADTFGLAEEVTELEGLVRGFPVGFESQLPGSIPKPGRHNPEPCVDARDSLERRQRTLKRPAALARRGAANADHFGLLWEVTPHRSGTSPQVHALIPVRCRRALRAR